MKLNKQIQNKTTNSKLISKHKQPQTELTNQIITNKHKHKTQSKPQWPSNK